MDKLLLWVVVGFVGFALAAVMAFAIWYPDPEIAENAFYLFRWMAFVGFGALVWAFRHRSRRSRR